MRVEVTRSFKWAPDGNNVRDVAVGEVLEGRGAEVALQLSSGRQLADVVAAEAAELAAPAEPSAAAAEPPAPTPAAPTPPARKRR